MSETARGEWSPFSDLPHALRATEQGKLMVWVRDILQPGWPDAASKLKPCWPMHADAVATLRGLRAKLKSIYVPFVEGGQIGGAPIWRMWDFDLDLDRAQDRWRGSFARCGGDAETCDRRKEPDDSEGGLLYQLLEDVTALAARAAWGTEPPVPDTLVEPWEIAALAAADQESAPVDW